jgi:UDP-2-acetamido-3-amino-2,3-dideoxy-glucuronate N-acetyltransferase
MNEIDSTAQIHPRALVDPGCHVGPRTRVWAFAHILPGAKIGADCNICDHVFIEGKVILGDRVTVKCGVYLWNGIRVEDDVFIGPNATFTNDKYPRSRAYLPEHPVTCLRQGCSIGAGAVILPGIEVGLGAMVGAGAVVTANVPPHAIVIGNPARVSGYAGLEEASGTISKIEGGEGNQPMLGGAQLRKLTKIADPRGDLVAGEWEKELPFVPQRFFMVHHVPDRRVRGQHAHRQCHQFLICLRGEVTVLLDDGTARQEVRLDDPRQGLHVPPMLWAVQYRYSEEAMLLVLASHPYEADDYIRDYDVYLKESRAP